LDERDGALVRDREDLLAAKARGFKTAVFLGEHFSAGEGEGYAVAVRLGPRFEHLGDGDVIGLDPGSRRLRVLYRRASKHNAFLVTERCNHYCLMCSQPPRKVDDGWILDEIADCIELIDPATETIGFHRRRTSVGLAALYRRADGGAGPAARDCRSCLDERPGFCRGRSCLGLVGGRA
jgi:hypothetical protein